jgi:hypothetical protein
MMEKSLNHDELDHIIQYYRRAMEGHVYIRETVDAMLATVARHVARSGRALRLLELGSHAGFITESLLKQSPDTTIVVCDEDETLVRAARERVQSRRVEYHVGPLQTLPDQFDLVVSIARHHHLPHDYLGGLRPRMKESSTYVLADELCPEYCWGAHAARVARATLLHIAGGYVLTSPAEVLAFQRDASLPTEARELERLRQRALWRWYRFVVDVAVERGYFDIAASELQSTHDDLITGSDAEHKFSPLIVERQFELAGYRQASKQLVGPEDDPERQSMFVFEYKLAP